MRIKKRYFLIIICIFILMGSVYGSNSTDTPSIDMADADEKEILSEDEDINIPDSVDVNSSKKVVIPVKSSSAISKENLTLKIDEDINDFEVVNNTIYFNYNLNSTSSLIINYKNLTKTAQLNRIYNLNFTAITTEAEYSCGSFKFQIFDIDNNNTPLANTTVSICGKQDSKTLYWITRTSSSSMNINSHVEITSDENGIITLQNSGFYPTTTPPAYIFAPLGQYTFTLTGKNQTKGSKSFNATIKKAGIKIILNPYSDYVGSTNPVTVNVVNANTGEAIKGTYIHVYMPNTDSKDYYFQSDENGICKISVTNLQGGTYQITITNNDTLNYNQTTTAGTITLKGKPTKITATFTSPIYFNSGKLVKIKITDKTTGKAIANIIVTVKIDSTTKYYTTNSKGIITITFAPMKIGKHKIQISVYDSKKYQANTISKTITVKKAQAKLKVKKVKAYYKQYAHITIKVKNKKNKQPIYMAKQYIKIYYTKNKYYKYYGQTGLDGKMRVYFDHLKPGTHKVEVTQNDKKNFKENTVTTKIIIKKAPGKLTAKKLTAKKGENSKFKVTLKNKKTKKVIKGVKLKIKVYTGKKYKTYTAKTNSKGIGQINVKNLKKGRHKTVITNTNPYVKAKSVKSSIKIT